MNILTIDTMNYDMEKIKTKQYISPTTGLEYVIISSNVEMDEHGDIAENPFPKYRSVITTPDPDRQILAVAPPSTMGLDEFVISYNSLKGPNDKEEDVLMVNELIEGTMINLFYDPRNASWEIATRSGVEGNYWFLRTEYGNTEPINQQTFREMLYDAIQTRDINTHFANYNKNYCYSFVLQHPNNHIVLPITTPLLYLVSIYEILPPREGNYQSVRFVPFNMDMFKSLQKHSIIYIPSIFPYHDLCDDIKEISNHYAMGVMLTHLKTGKQTPVVNSNYEIMKKIRGNHPNMQYHFFQLLKTGKLFIFLQYFPNYNELFTAFNERYQQFIIDVQQAYYNYYVKKIREKIPKYLFLHINRIHREIYMPTRKIIKRAVVAEYFHNMTASQLVYYMNDHMKIPVNDTPTPNTPEI